MTDKQPEWVQTDLDFIADLRTQSEKYLTQADESSSDATTERLSKEAAICVEYADLVQDVLDARIEVKNGSEDKGPLVAAEEALVAFRTEWRGIHELRQSGYLHEFAAEAAESKD